METLTKVVVDDKKYILKSQKTFLNLKQEFLQQFEIVLSHFEVESCQIADNLLVDDFGKCEIIGVPDDKTYTKYKKDSYRCSECRETFVKATMKCKHSSKCKNKSLREKKHSLLIETLSSIEKNSLTISSIDKITDSEKNDSSFLSIYKTDTKTQTENLQKNSSSLCITQDSSHAHQDISGIEEKE